MDETSVLLSKLGDVEGVRDYIGQLVGFSGGRALVDIEGSRIPVFPWGVVPKVTDPVRVLVVKGKPYLVGVTYLQPDTGVVGAVGSSAVQVLTDAGTLEGVLFGGDTAPSTGATVVLKWTDRGPVVLMTLVSAPEPPAPPAPPVAQVVTATKIFTATSSGTWNNGGASPWTKDVYAGSSTIGGYGYGSKIRDTLRGATVRRVEFKAKVKRDSGNLPRIGTQPREKIEGSVPTVSNLMSLPRPLGGWELLFDAKSKVNGIAAALKAGGGIGFDGAGFAIFQGLGQFDDEVGALKITYTK